MDLYHPLLKSTFALNLKKRDKKKEKARAETEGKRRRELEGLLERVGGKLEGGQGKRGKGRGSEWSFPSVLDLEAAL
jgi:signal recognition particle subunit SRP14